MRIVSAIGQVLGVITVGKSRWKKTSVMDWGWIRGFERPWGREWVSS
jgi:hypothetical protein